MKQNIITIKNILRIIISIFVIATMIKSCAKAVTQNLINLDYEVSSSTAILEELINHFNVPNKNASNKNFVTMQTEWVNAERKSFYYSYTNYGEQYNFDFWYGSGTGPTSPNSQNLNFRPSNFFRLNSWRGREYTASYQYDSSLERPQPDILYYCCYIDDNNNLWEYSSDGYSVVNGLIPPFTYTQFGMTLSGDTDIKWLKINYVSNFIPLGVLGDNTYYQLDARIRDNLSMLNLFNWSDVPEIRKYIK